MDTRLVIMFMVLLAVILIIAKGITGGRPGRLIHFCTALLGSADQSYMDQEQTDGAWLGLAAAAATIAVIVAISLRLTNCPS